MKKTLLTLMIFSLPIMAWAQAESEGSENEAVEGKIRTSNVTTGSGGSNSGGSSTIQIDEFMGAATHSVTIPVPPGRAGVEPQLTLNYHSHRKNPNSWVGYGWELDIGSIERTAENGRVDLESGERFEAHFGGQSEELYLSAKNVSAGEYQITLPPNTQLDLYRARVDNAFNLYLFIKSNDSDTPDGGWIVLDKSGKRYEFGQDQSEHVPPGGQSDDINDARIGALGRPASKWLLTRVVDPNDNEMIANYDGDHVLTNIDYSQINILFTGGSSTRSYYPQYRQSFLKRDDIKILSGIEIRDASNQFARLQKFILTYELNTDNSFTMLKRIQQFGKTDAASLPATTFSYYEGGGQIRFSTNAVRYNTGSSHLGETNGGLQNNQTQYADMNGDGLVDQVLGFVNSGDFKVLYNNGHDFVEIPGKSDWAEPFDCQSYSKYSCKGRVIYYGDNGKDQLLFLMDINGDALPDRIRGLNLDESDGYFEVALNTGTRWANPVPWIDPIHGNDSGRSTRRCGFLDMNGDGLVDRIEGKPSDKGFNVYLNNGASFETSAVFWTDPLGVEDSNFSAAGYLYDFNPSNGHIYLMTRDMNGDGLPDRAVQAKRIDINDATLKYVGFSVYLNTNGLRWAMPRFNPNGLVAINTVDHLFMDDYATINPNHPDKEYNGLITRRHDFLDFNSDGYLDRVVSLKPSISPTGKGRFEVYLFNGLEAGEVTEYFSKTPLIIEDPVGNETSDPWGGAGYLGKSDSDSTDAERHTYLQDMNGDGYLDRVTSTKTGGLEDAVVHYFEANKIAVSDTADDNTHSFNQPLYALKKVSTGVGIESVVEYAPSTEKLQPDSPGFTDHRFMPFNTYAVHKSYSTDFTMEAQQKADAENYPEGLRNPGMRWLRYDYKGGHLFIRKAIEDVRKPYQRFVGFHEAIKTPIHLASDAWQPYQSLTRYYQPKGEQDTPLIPESALNAYFDPAGYGHFALTGKPYFQKVALNGQDLVIEKSELRLENGDEDLFSCAGSCFSYVFTQSKFVHEPAGGIRGSQKEFHYDNTTGNLTQTDEYQLSSDGGQRTLLLSNLIQYSPDASLVERHILDRISSQKQVLADKVYRHKSFSYDTKGNPTEETFLSQAGGTPDQIMRRTFNPLGNVTEITEADNVKKKYTYDSHNLFPTQETVVGGTVNLTTTRIFNRLIGKPSQEIGPNGVGKRIVYDDFGRVLEEYLVPAAGSQILNKKYRYTDQIPVTFNGLWHINLSKIEVFDLKPDYPTESASQPGEITYVDGSGGVLQKCSLSERGNYRVLQNRTSNGGQLEIVTEPVFRDDCPFFGTLQNTKTAKTTKDFMGRTLSVVYPEGDGTESPMSNIATTYRATANGHLITKTIQGSQSKEQEFDITERLVRVTDTAGSAIFYDYNPVGDLTKVSDDDGELTNIEYDTLGRKIRMTDKHLGTWAYEYDDQGRLLTQTDAKNQKIRYFYDGLGRITSKVTINDAGGQEKRDAYVYDVGEPGHSVLKGELGKILEYEGTNTTAGNEIRTTTFGYDPLFRRTNKLTRQIKILINNQIQTRKLTQDITNDVKGRVTKTVYPSGVSVFYQYNVAGGLMKTCDKQDCSGEVYHSIDPTQGYDEFGAIQKEVFGNGVTADYTYYPNSHRLMNRKVALGDTIHSERQYTFDSFSNMTSLQDMQNQKGSASWTIVNYDNLNRLTSYRDKQDKTEGFEYDKSGNMLKNTASYGNKSYQYNPDRPHAVTQIGEGPDAERFTYDDNGNMLTDKYRSMIYNGQNQLKKVTMQNGVVVSYDYDYTGARVTKRVTRKDPLGKITNSETHFLGDALEVRGNQVHLHINSGSQRLATLGLGNFTDLFGAGGATVRNINMMPGMGLPVLMPWLMLTTVLLIMASLRPIEKVPTWAFRMRSRGKGMEQTYGLNLINIWSRYTQSLHQAIQLYSVNRFAKTISAILILVTTTLFPLAQVAIAGDTGAPLSTIDDEQYFVYYHGDHLGSTHIITEGKSSGLHSGITYPKGNLLQRIEYAPFGKELYVLNANLKFDPRYTGQEYDIETGLYYYKARYYNPTLGRFIQADTVVPDAKNLQAFNRYAYAANNPLKYTDPSGHGFWSWFKKLFGAFISALIGVLITVFSMGTLTPIVAAMLGGLIGGAINGAITGGLKGALFGALFGAVSGLVFGGLNAAIGSSLNFVQKLAVFGGIGLGLAGATGGWRGMLTFAAGFAGGLLGAAATGAFSKNGQVLEKSTTSDASSNQASGTSDNGNYELKLPERRISFDYQGAPDGSNSNASVSPGGGSGGTPQQSLNLSRELGQPIQLKVGPATLDSAALTQNVKITPETFLQKVFNENTLFAWMAGGTLVGGISGGVAIGPLGVVAGGILGSGAGVIWWFNGYQIANDGILSIMLPFGHNWTKWPAPTKP